MSEQRHTPDAPLTLNLSAGEREVAFKLMEAGQDFLNERLSAAEHEDADAVISKLFTDNEARR